MTIQLTKYKDGTMSVAIIEKTVKEINDWYDEFEMLQKHDDWVQREYEHLKGTGEFFHITYPTFQHP